MASSSRPVKEESTEGPNWLDLPNEVTTKILLKLEAFEILGHASQVCSLWWKICKDPFMWRTIDLMNPRSFIYYAALNFCRRAIKRSCDHLEDISIGYLGNNEVLKYIANNASHLRRMKLLKWGGVTNKGLNEAVKKFSLLEEFEISVLDISRDTLELIGQSCPLLKVMKLKLFIKFFEGVRYNGEAFAIAKTMPGLHHLQLFRNRLTNGGLLAILDGCPHLESLDLRACYNVDLSGSLGERCHKQIKDLYFPKNLGLLISLEDYDDDDDYAYDDCFFNPVCGCECGCGWDQEGGGIS